MLRNSIFKHGARHRPLGGRNVYTSYKVQRHAWSLLRSTIDKNYGNLTLSSQILFIDAPVRTHEMVGEPCPEPAYQPTLSQTRRRSESFGYT